MLVRLERDKDFDLWWDSIDNQIKNDILNIKDFDEFTQIKDLVEFYCYIAFLVGKKLAEEDGEN